MIFLSAGHHLRDPGAVSKFGIERDLAIELRNLVEANLKTKGAKYVIDNDSETLGQYLARIKPGSGSVVVEIHWNAAMSTTATGTEVLIADNHNKLSKDLATELSAGIAAKIGIKNRGVKTEKDSARGKLAFVRQPGACCLIEVCFVSNPDDMKKYQSAKCELAAFIADVLIKYEAKV